MDIFKEFKLYPDEDEFILSHFAELYESVFIAYLPFFQIKDYNLEKISVQKSHQISLEEFRTEKDEVFANIQGINATIYSYENDEYPEDEVIFDDAKIISWQEIKAEASFKDYAEIYKALKTSIGSYRKVFQKIDLCEKLKIFTEKEKIFHPTEGNFGVLSKVEIYNALKTLNKNEIIVIDEFYENEKELNLNFISPKEFNDKIEDTDRYIYAKDKSILFTIEWDSFFYLICSNKKTIDEILKNSNIEGFFCNSKTKDSWVWKEKEIIELLEIESQAEEKSYWTKLKDILIDK